jgi:hypothetical protein
MAVLGTIQAYVRPVLGWRRFSVRKTGVFSCALPTTTIRSVPQKRERYSWTTSSVRCRFVKVMSGMLSFLTNQYSGTGGEHHFGAPSQKVGIVAFRCLAGVSVSSIQAII